MMVASQTQQKPKDFTCFRCGEVIKLKRKADNSGWIRLNLDNKTEHQCVKKNKPQQQAPLITASASTASVASSSSSSNLECKLDALIAEVQDLRLELQKTRK